MKQVLLIILVIGLLVAIVWLPIPVPTNSDFQVLYRADLSLRHGISLYDHEGQVRMWAGILGKPADSVYIVPYPYPPWYALTTLPLALFNVQVAARVWFLLNLLMVMAAVWLLTDGWPPRRRLPAFPLAFLFLPVLGNVWVGQYGAPALLGAAMLAYGLRREIVAPTVLGLALLTFKPQTGTLVLLTGLIYLVARRDRFSRRALGMALLAGLLLLAAGFMASPVWPLDYFHSLTSFRNLSQGIQSNSLAMALSSLLGGGFGQAVLIGAGLLALIAAWLVYERRLLAANPGWLVAAAILGSLVASPYLQDYDYLLLIVPLLAIASRARGIDWLWLAVAYLLPIAGLSISAFQLDLSPIAATLIVFALFVRMIHRSEGSPAQAAGQLAG